MTESVSYSIPRIVVSGLRGGSGKTILSLCLVALFRKKGLTVTPFKKGPDYIDAGWLAKAAGVSCYNLDLFMMSKEQALQSFIEHTHEKCKSAEVQKCRRKIEVQSEIPDPNSEMSSHIAIIEGNRGLYDGVDHEGTYSTAELAKLLKAPVILIVDCTKATNTVAAMVLGCQKMDEKVPIGGVVLNRVATARQESVIRKAINERCSLPVVGVIPRLKKDPFPERHMGLTPFQETNGVEESLALVVEIGEKYIDIDSVLKIAGSAGNLQNTEQIEVKKMRRWEDEKKMTPKLSLSQPLSFSTSQPLTPNPAVKIGIIRDSAFQFYYQENFEELEKRGASLIEVSPLRETKLPDIDALYIGGGFPETHAIALAENVSFRNALYNAIQNGLPVYAECGGLMYLGKSIILDNKTYPMVGALPVVFDLERRPQAHGYTVVEVEKANPFYQVGTVLKGHEFHYSRVLEINTPLTLLKAPTVGLNRGESCPHLKKGDVGGFSEQIYMAFNVRRGNGIIDGKDGLCYKNVFATYTHLHAIGAPEWADGLIKCAVKFCADRK
ncbi:MAG: cobyrinate a,c-diamide synthase [Nitrospirae bacterium]|nr:cobyrinate a,c-diamide synthase [Nitrospirota bacterium]